MKQRPCASNRSLSKLCRILLLALTLKIAVLGVMLYDPLAPGLLGKLTGTDANAAETSPATAPAVSPIPQSAGAASLNAGGLPDVGMRATPGQTQNPTTPGAVPGIAAQPVTSASPNAVPAGLPLIRKQNAPIAPGAPGAPGANGTASSPDIARDSLTRKQEEVARKEQELQALEGEISGKLEKMQLLENRVQTMMKDAESTRDAKFRHLVDVLSNMKAKQAAATLETMDQRIAVKLLAGMRGRQAGEILTYVKPEVAAHLTEALARMQLPLE